MMKIASLFWTVLTVTCCSLNQVGESKNNCGEDEYYESAIQQCRSCSIPCKMSKALCQEMCPGFQANTTVQSITEVHESKNNCGEDEYYESAIEQCKSCSEACLLSEANCREMCPDYQKLTTMKPAEGFKMNGEAIAGLTAVTSFLTIIFTLMGIYRSWRKRKKKRKEKKRTSLNPGGAGNQNNDVEMHQRAGDAGGAGDENQQGRQGSSQSRQGSSHVHQIGIAQGAGNVQTVHCEQMTVNQMIYQAQNNPTRGPPKDDEDPNARDSSSSVPGETNTGVLNLEEPNEEEATQVTPLLVTNTPTASGGQRCGDSRTEE